tara:strand:+ start:739 stop:984 length:246 start_codon:yes stop_codon:yes gene_type:complete
MGRLRARVQHAGPDARLFLKNTENFIGEISVTARHGQEVIDIDRRLAHAVMSRPLRSPGREGGTGHLIRRLNAFVAGGEHG